MPSIKSHSRGLRGLVPASFLVTVSIILIGSIGWWFGTQNIATQHPAGDSRKLARAWDRAVSFNNVDLFALISTAPEKPEVLAALSTFDRSLYAQIFALQEKGDWPRANALIKRLHSDILLGHVLYDRYIRAQDYKASYAELRQWMVNYGDHPDAYKVYQLAQKRRQNDPASLPAPQITQKLFGSLELAWLKKESKNAALAYRPAKRDNAAVRQLMATIKRRLAADQVTSAYNYLGASPVSKTLSAIEYDSLLSEIAGGYYYNAKYEAALSVANQSIKRSKDSVPFASWIAGLAAWQKKEYGASARHFEAVLDAHNRNPWMLSAAAFWAARAHEKMGHKAIRAHSTAWSPCRRSAGTRSIPGKLLL
jgi:soluble lytic murein transglycosylase